MRNNFKNSVRLDASEHSGKCKICFVEARKINLIYEFIY